MGQAFHMISGPSINDLLTNRENRLTNCSRPEKQPRIIDELYWIALTERQLRELDAGEKYVSAS
jgi:hypothetical protein